MNEILLTTGGIFLIFLFISEMKYSSRVRKPSQKNIEHIEWCGRHPIFKKRVDYHGIQIKPINDLHR